MTVAWAYNEKILYLWYSEDNCTVKKYNEKYSKYITVKATKNNTQYT